LLVEAVPASDGPEGGRVNLGKRKPEDIIKL